MSTATEPKTILITGASSGIGLGLAQAYAATGANVVLNGRDEAKLVDVAQSLEAPDRIAVVPGDIADRATNRQIVEQAVKRFGRVDVLVNNAGHFFTKPFGEFTEEDLDRFLDVHLKGTFFTSQAAAEQMRRQGGGAIVNITTVLAFRGLTAIKSSGPAAAKGGVNSLTRNLAIELAADNIRVNAVAPGIIRTPIHGQSDEQLDQLGPVQPLGRIGEVQDIVDAVRYLADANFVTGVILPVDGGLHAGGA